MTAAVTVRGADTLARTLHACGRELTHLDDAHAAAGAIVQRTAAARARRRTGRLASGFTVGTTAAGASVTNPVRYAAVQEYGSVRRGISASLALTGALDAQADQVAGVYDTAVTRAVSKVRGA